MRIEIHDDDGHVYGYEKGDDPFAWNVSIDGRPMPRTSKELDGRDVLWQLAVQVLKDVDT